MRILTREELELVAGGFDTGVTVSVTIPGGDSPTDPSGGIGGDGNGGSGGSGGSGGGSGGSGGGASGPTGEQAIQWANSKLGMDISGLASHSPSLQGLLQAAEQRGWDIQYNNVNQSKTQYPDASHAAVIYIQANAQGNLEATVQQLAHELYHAYNTNPLQPTSLSLEAYVNGMMLEEGGATFQEAKVRAEILGATNTDIGIPGQASNLYLNEWNNYANDPAHWGVYATSQAMANTYAAYEHIADGRTYQQYYTDAWHQATGR